jgi:enamine deaminase RidA (YjgF/YER057c/UK114 family)
MKVSLALLLLTSVLLPGCVPVRSLPQRTCFHSNESIEKEIGFCQALQVGNTLHISGVAGQGEMGSAVRSVYARLKQILEANGLSFANVVKENVFATDLDAFIRNKEIRKEFYGPTLPAASWVQVQRLYVPSFVVEVELTAEFPK